MDGGERRAGAAWARRLRRRRWASLLALGIIVGLTAGGALAAFAGSRRTASALARLRTVTHAPDAVVFASQAGVTEPDWNRLRARPGVADVAVWELVFGRIPGDDEEATLFAPDTTGGWLSTTNRPVVVEGRMFDPNRPDEAVVSEALTPRIPVGARISFTAYAKGQDDTRPDPPAGPKTTFTVVGRVRTVNQFLFVPDQLFLSPAYLATHRDEINIFQNADVRLREPATIAGLRRTVDDVVAPGTPLLSVRSAGRRIETTISVEHAALVLVAITILVAGGLLVAQALLRSAGSVGEDAPALRAMGMTRSAIAGAAVGAHATTALVAAAIAFASAAVASRLFPVALGRKVDPDVGFHVDWPVLLTGALVAGAAVALATYLVARRAARPAPHTGPSYRSRLVAAVTRSTPPAVGLGTTMALQPGRGSARVAVRPALVASMIGVLGVIGAMAINRGIDDALAHPERAGVVWDVDVVPFTDVVRAPAPLDAALANAVAAAAPRGTRIAQVDRGTVSIAGVGAPVFAIRPTGRDRAAPITCTVTEGRAPRDDHEAVVGPKTLADIGAGVGDEVPFGARGDRVRIVGEGLFPSDVHAEFDEGAWVTPGLFDRTVDAADPRLALDLPAGANLHAAVGALSGVDGVAYAAPVEVPQELTNLDNVRTLPLVVAGFLALLAIAALCHVLVTSARRRTHEFAILRVLGMERRSCRSVVNVQGTVVALVGVVAGIPLGIAVGRSLWRLVADRVPLANVGPVATVAIVASVPVTLAVANLLALWPGRRVTHLPPAEALRTE